MTFLSIIGWLVIVAIALYFSIASYGILFAIAKFGATSDRLTATVLCAFAVAFWYLAYANCPFTITMNS